MGTGPIIVSILLLFTWILLLLLLLLLLLMMMISWILLLLILNISILLNLPFLDSFPLLLLLILKSSPGSKLTSLLVMSMLVIPLAMTSWQSVQKVAGRYTLVAGVVIRTRIKADPITLPLFLISQETVNETNSFGWN